MISILKDYRTLRSYIDIVRRPFASQLIFNWRQFEFECPTFEIVIDFQPADIIVVPVFVFVVAQ